jgi:hypothetical protein
MLRENPLDRIREQESFDCAIQYGYTFTLVLVWTGGRVLRQENFRLFRRNSKKMVPYNFGSCPNCNKSETKIIPGRSGRPLYRIHCKCGRDIGWVGRRSFPKSYDAAWDAHTDAVADAVFLWYNGVEDESDG